MGSVPGVTRWVDRNGVCPRVGELSGPEWGLSPVGELGGPEWGPSPVDEVTGPEWGLSPTSTTGGGGESGAIPGINSPARGYFEACVTGHAPSVACGLSRCAV